MTNNPIRWFEIYVENLPRAKKFYEAVFQTTLQQLNAPFAEIELWQFPANREQYGASGALVRMQGVSPGHCSTIVYFGCEDCAVEEARVVEAGGQIHRPKMSIGQYGFITLAYDTEGNMFGLHSMQ